MMRSLISRIINFANYRQLPGNGTLQFPAFAGQFFRSDIHDTIYRCQASNQIGVVLSRNVRVRSIIRQNYNIQVEGRDVYLGNVAFLKCVIPSHVKFYVEVSAWYRGEEMMTESSDISEYLKSFI
jgi:hypothetical protein